MTWRDIEATPTRNRHSITLKTLQGLTVAVSFGELRQAVNQAAVPATPS